MLNCNQGKKYSNGLLNISFAAVKDGVVFSRLKETWREVFRHVYIPLPLFNLSSLGLDLTRHHDDAPVHLLRVQTGPAHLFIRDLCVIGRCSWSYWPETTSQQFHEHLLQNFTYSFLFLSVDKCTDVDKTWNNRITWDSLFYSKLNCLMSNICFISLRGCSQIWDCISAGALWLYRSKRLKENTKTKNKLESHDDNKQKCRRHTRRNAGAGNTHKKTNKFIIYRIKLEMMKKCCQVHETDIKEPAEVTSPASRPLERTTNTSAQTIWDITLRTSRWRHSVNVHHSKRGNWKTHDRRYNNKNTPMFSDWQVDMGDVSLCVTPEMSPKKRC